MEQPQWSNGVILDVKQELGKIKGRVTGIEASMKETRQDAKETRKDVKEILKSVATVPEMQRALNQHGQRLSDLEHKGVAYDATLAKIEKHLEEDEPTSHYVDRSIATWAESIFIAWSGTTRFGPTTPKAG
jgi:predicted  nucleic acid-binding Zn-ribbon protein